MIALQIAKNQQDFAEISSLGYNVFVEEQQAIENNSKNDYFDEWDEFSINLIAAHSEKAVGTGRLIFMNNKVSFRVSSSLNLHRYFTDLNKVVEISGLCIDKNYRNRNVASLLHYARIRIAKFLNVDFIIATTSKETSNYLLNFGFEIICPEFEYLPYATDRKSVFLALDLTSKPALTKMDHYFSDKIPATKAQAHDLIQTECFWLQQFKGSLDEYR